MHEAATSDFINCVARSARSILLNDGCVGISDITHQTGLGVRQFERRFRSEIGIAPKLYARIVRFEATLRRKAAAPQMRWTDVAHTLAYHDQMHMVHDFNRLSGDSPTAICSQLAMFVQPEVVCDFGVTKLNVGSSTEWPINRVRFVQR